MKKSHQNVGGRRRHRKERYRKHISKFVEFEIPPMDKEQTVVFAEGIVELLSRERSKSVRKELRKLMRD